MLLFLFIASAFASVSICDKALTSSGPRSQVPYVFHISGISLNPAEEVARSQIVRLNVNYTTPILITEGTSMTTIRYHGLALPSLKQSICDLTSCPIQPGKHNFTYSFQYPFFPGRTTTTIMWYDANATIFICLKILLRSISTIY